MKTTKEPLYRKVNTKARNVCHNFGGDFKHSRHKKKDDVQKKGAMSSKTERGLDYGKDWIGLVM